MFGNIYFYVGYLKNGKRKAGFVKSEETGEESEKEIRRNLKEKSIFVKNLYKISISKEKQKPIDILNLFAESRMFIKNGYPFLKILEILEENQNLRKYTKKMKISMKQGKNMYEIFKESGIKLRDSEFMIIKAGEESGNICRAFETIEQGIKEREENRKTVRKILLYPSMVLAMVAALIIFLGIFILPDFIKIIEISDKELPLITRIIIWCSNNFLYIIFGFICAVYTIFYLLKNIKYREKLFQKFILIKIFKNIINKIFISIFTDSLAVLLNSGITITESISLIKNEIKYRYFIEKLSKTENELRKGNTIYSVFKNMDIFTTTEAELIKAGEEAGELVEVLELISHRTKAELKQKTEIAIKLLEPAAIIIVGTVVGIVFLGIYMPIFQIMDSI